MTDSETANQPKPRTYKAAIAFVASSLGRSTIVMKSGGSWVSDVLPLTEVTVTLHPNEVLIVSNGTGETRYARELTEALEIARSLGCECAPDAIQILAPAIADRRFNTYNLESIYERAVAAS